MTNAIKFTLSGKTAFFKNPEVNTYCYFTYGNIHKIALIGLFGAMLGYNGYRQMPKAGKRNATLEKQFPEFYEKLIDLKISIVPNSQNGSFAKSVQQFNNSVGYASKETGGNLIVKEQWLINPSWDIYILLDNEEAEKIKESLLSSKTVFTLYLGKNDHLADISNPKIVSLSICEDDNTCIDSLYPRDRCKIRQKTNDLFDDSSSEVVSFKYEEFLPFSLDSYTNLYNLESFVFTNRELEIIQGDFYKAEDRNIIFF